MSRFITRRITFIVLVCIAIIFLSYLGMGMIRNSETNSPNYNLIPQIKIAWSQSHNYIFSILKGEVALGLSQAGPPGGNAGRGSPYLNSMALLVIALGGATLIGLPLGTFAALTKYKKLVFPLLLLVLVGISTPTFFSGFLLQQLEIYSAFYFDKKLVSVAGFGWDIEHMLLPVLVLAARPLAYLTRTSFIVISRVMEDDYIRTAYAKGLGQRRVVNIHAMRNVAVPILTAVGISLRFSLGSLPIVEFLFFWPGIGLRLLEAIESRQVANMVTMTLSLGLTILAVNLILDIIYRFVDPRTRGNDL